MVVLTNALERILKGMQKNDPQIASLLQPGLKFWEIEEKLRVLPFRLPQDFYGFYQWKNGFISTSKKRFSSFGGHDFFDLNWLIKNYFFTIEDEKKNADFSKRFPAEHPRTPQWFSLLGHDKQDYFIIGEQEQKQTSPVFCFDYGNWDDFRPKLKYSCLTSMMLTIAECYETGAYYDYKVEGRDTTCFGMNYPAAESIRKKYNPDCEYDALIEELI
ncbi:MAG: hypothetical protein JGK24_32305 [Microcoleus sp. PH2017_29_MFU_D_A]|uniref:SMI1/KNR4 family protein n=1 Tax=unclassified Microcoleus TaxID=2642155 RepID=UPI001D63606F|nr:MULTISPECIES: SMI1/KNR4 family protein [unclassified Microcoleus]MCC3607784.1 hypothetical protein [Microcoleus sp. PH2017_29_MFU_D_A]MCC3638871.1 hypothetical protein [Microcoleus sp. PH2017_37_MFU_D_B]